MSASPSDAAAHESEHAEEEGPKASLGAVARIRWPEMGLRFAFGFVISVAAGLVTTAAGPVVGGICLGFPAILPATITLLEKHDGQAQALSDIRGATLGALGMVAFAAVVGLLAARWNAWVLLAALAAWLAVSLLAYGGGRLLIRLLGEKQYLPEISTSEAAAAVAQLRRAGWTVGVAESCTGGLVAALLTRVPGASDVIRGGVVTYADDAKVDLLGVRAETVLRHGAVSRETASEMAAAVRRLTKATVGISITGVSGHPAEGKPAGTAYLGITGPEGDTHVHELRGDHGPGRNEERFALEVFRDIAKLVNDR